MAEYGASSSAASLRFGGKEMKREMELKQSEMPQRIRSNKRHAESSIEEILEANKDDSLVDFISNALGKASIKRKKPNLKIEIVALDSLTNWYVLI